MSLSQQEKQIVEFGAKENKSREEILKALEKFRAQSIPKEKVGRIKETASDIGETFKGVVEQFGKAGEKIVKTATQKDLTLGEKARGIGAEAFRGGSRAFGETILGAGKVLLPQSAEDKIEGIVQELGKKVGGLQITQDLVAKYNSLSPDARREVDNALGFAEGLADIFAFGAASKLSKQAISTAVKSVEKAAQATKATTKLIRNTTPKSIKGLYAKMKPGNREAAISSVTDSYKKSFVVNSAATSKQLQKQARGRKNVDGTKTTSDDLLRGLAEEGYIPVVDGKLAKFGHVIDNLSARQARLAEGINPLLATVPEITTRGALKSIAKRVLHDSPQIGADLNRSLRELDNMFASFGTKYGDDLSALEVNEIRLQMNRQTRAFKDELFKQDTADAIADAARVRLDELVPSGIVKQTNAQIGRLFGLKRTAEILDFKTINVGVIGGQLGRYMGVVGASGIGFTAAGPGGLVVAGIAAHYGGEVLAKILRSRRFSKKLKETIIQGIKQDDELVQKLIQETADADKAFLERVLLKSPEETAIPLKETVSRLDSSDVSPARLKEFIAQIEGQATRAKAQIVIQEQAKRFTKRETFIEAVRSNPNWLKKVEAAGTTPESIADIVFKPPLTKGVIPKELKNLTHSKIGKIEIVIGKTDSKTSKGFGLLKIQDSHPEVIPNFVERFKKAKIVERLPQRTILQTEEKIPLRIIIDHQLGREKKTFLNNAYNVRQ